MIQHQHDSQRSLQRHSDAGELWLATLIDQFEQIGQTDLRPIPSDAAIVRADHFMQRSLASVDEGSGAGLYPAFVGLRSNVKGKTDFQLLLEDLGVEIHLGRQPID